MRSSAMILALLPVALWGCGSSASPLPSSPPIPVSGKVLYRGKPLTRGKVLLEPTDGGHEAQATIQPDGSFVATTFADGDGALLGVHRVSITEAEPHVKPKGETHLRVSEGKSSYVIEFK